ncbi:MAG: VCBS repeat-containing protein [Candidatus Hydrogenedentes bacterium]|nr:VCBS repeat-containing protein [Candidatus Hydrogenedentota bacterium]
MHIIKKPWILTLLFITFTLVYTGCELNEENPDPNVQVRYFHAPYLYPTGGVSYQLAVGDFNKDGAPDLAVSNYDKSTVAILIRDPEKGNFKLHEDYTVGINPGMLAVSDLDIDSYLDIVVANQGEDTVSVLYGKEEGKFEEAIKINLSTGSRPSAVCVGDVNKDGKPDLLVAESGTNSIALLVNEGNRNLGNLYSISSGRSPRWLLLTDLDNDSETDLVVSNRDDNNISVLLSKEGSLFGVRKDYQTGLYPRTVESIDLDGDGYKDLIVANPGSKNYSIFKNNTQGDFLSLGTIDSVGSPFRFILEDVNLDGIKDIISVLYGEIKLSTGEIKEGPLGSAEILKGEQGGTFRFIKLINLGIGSADIALEDLNADTHKELIFTLSGLNKVGIWYGNSNLYEKAEERVNFEDGAGLLIATNIDSTPKKELIIASATTPVFHTAKLEDKNLISLGKWLLGSPVQTLLAEKIDSGNNSTDLLLIERGSSNVTAYLNNGEGVFQKKGEFSVKDPSISHKPLPNAIATGDVNGDGFIDLVTSNPSTDSISVLLGDGTGNFSSAKETIVGNYPTAVKLSDVNRDNKLDLLFVSSKDPSDPDDQAPPRFVVWFGNGDGTFNKDTQKRYATESAPKGLLLVDLDRDGDSDVLTIHPSSGTVVLFGAKQDGSFVNLDSIYIGKYIKSVYNWDINNDGTPDIVSINGDGTLTVLLNNGNMRFSTLFYYVAHAPISGAPFDIDGDAIWDVIISNYASNDFSLVYGRTYP